MPGAYAGIMSIRMVVTAAHEAARGPRPRGGPAEVDAYLDLLRTGGGGRAFLKIMRGFERTRAKRDLYRRVLGDGRYPVRVVWGASDPALKLATEGEAARRAAGAGTIHTLPAKHFPQEDQAPAVAGPIARLAGPDARKQALVPPGPRPVARSCQSRASCRATAAGRADCRQGR